MPTSQYIRRWTLGWLGELFRSRLVLATTALIFLLLAAVEILSGAAALFGFVLVSVATAIAMRGEAAASSPPIEQAAVAESGNSILEKLLAGFPNPVIVLNRRGEVVDFNARAGAIAPGLRRREPLSFSLRAPALIEAVRLAEATGTPQRAEISERIPLDRWYEASVTPLATRNVPTASGIDLIVVTLNDLTALRRVEEMRVDFVANASHELRTPLAALLGFIETLMGPAKDDPTARARFLPIMQAQATRMARLIDDLLSLSRIELNAHQRPEVPIDLVPVLKQVCDSLQTLARDRGVEIRTEFSETSVMVPGNRDELTRVFENLVENALKYGASGKRVDLRLTLTPGASGRGEAVIAVQDYGPGIAPEHLPRLTERFYRVNVTQSREQGGTGLGLALVKHILNRHAGRLSIESTQGHGATFTARLPVAVEKTPARPALS